MKQISINSIKEKNIKDIKLKYTLLLLRIEIVQSIMHCLIHSFFYLNLICFLKQQPSAWIYISIYGFPIIYNSKIINPQTMLFHFISLYNNIYK
jgi:hypothetical protein